MKTSISHRQQDKSQPTLLISPGGRVGEVVGVVLLREGKPLQKSLDFILLRERGRGQDQGHVVRMR